MAGETGVAGQAGGTGEAGCSHVPDGASPSAQAGRREAPSPALEDGGARERGAMGGELGVEDEGNASLLLKDDDNDEECRQGAVRFMRASASCRDKQGRRPLTGQRSVPLPPEGEEQTGEGSCQTRHVALRGASVASFKAKGEGRVGKGGMSQDGEQQVLQVASLLRQLHLRRARAQVGDAPCRA